MGAHLTKEMILQNRTPLLIGTLIPIVTGWILYSLEYNKQRVSGSCLYGFSGGFLLAGSLLYLSRESCPPDKEMGVGFCLGAGLLSGYKFFFLK